MQRYSILTLVGQALRSNKGWRPAWRDSQLSSHYDVVIVGGGGHGLAAAYYLAREYGMRRIAVLERGWIGGGNSGRNTQVVRSNYFHSVSAALYDHSLKLYEQLGSELNFNVMLSQRGYIHLAHSEHDLEIARRWFNSVRMSGVDAEMLTSADIERLAAPISLWGRYPITGGFLQDRKSVV